MATRSELQTLYAQHKGRLSVLFPMVNGRSTNTRLIEVLTSIGVVPAGGGRAIPSTPSISRSEVEVDDDYSKKHPTIQRRWRIEALIGEGGFARVYRAKELKRGTTEIPPSQVAPGESSSQVPLEGGQSTMVAIKLFTKKEDSNEIEVLREVYPERVLGEGMTIHSRKRIRFIAIPLHHHSLSTHLSRNGVIPYEEVRRMTPSMIAGIEYLHSKGWIHNDIKPGNFVFRNDGDTAEVVLIDFGLARRYRSAPSLLSGEGEHLPLNTDEGFCGTYRYASISAHRRITRSRRDDLESLLYVRIWLTSKMLPWADMGGKQTKLIIELKEKYGSELVPPGLQQYHKAVRSLAYEEEPNYRELLRYLCD